MTSSTLKWLSVWCRQFSVNFGDVVFDNVVIPTATSSPAAAAATTSTATEKSSDDNSESQAESEATKIACPILTLTASLVITLATNK